MSVRGYCICAMVTLDPLHRVLSVVENNKNVERKEKKIHLSSLFFFVSCHTCHIIIHKYTSTVLLVVVKKSSSSSSTSSTRQKYYQRTSGSLIATC